MSDDDRPYVIERSGPKGRIKLNAAAKEWAKIYGMTNQEMAKHLLLMDHLGEDYVAGEAESSEQGEEPLNAPLRELHGEPSVNVEDRREDPLFVPSRVDAQIWGQYPHDVAPQAQTYGVNPLSRALGFTDIGKRPAPAPQVLGPFRPQYPAPFGNTFYNRPTDLPFE
jgi:hypothetical protein